jgi:bacterioferritin-associated ferredoxin
MHNKIMHSSSNSIDEIIAKVSLAAEITQVALDCPYCRGTVKQLIRDHKSAEIQPDRIMNTEMNTENLQEGGPSTDANRLTEHVIKNDRSQQYK